MDAESSCSLVTEQISHSPTLRAQPDAIGQVIAGATAILKHFPDAESANLSIFSHREDGRYVAFCQISIHVTKPT